MMADLGTRKENSHHIGRDVMVSFAFIDTFWADDSLDMIGTFAQLGFVRCTLLSAVLQQGSP